MKHNDSGSGRKRWFKYVVEFQIDRTWVADGAEITDEDARDMLVSRIPYAYNPELKARVIEAPKQSAIRKVQGYNQ